MKPQRIGKHHRDRQGQHRRDRGDHERVAQHAEELRVLPIFRAAQRPVQQHRRRQREAEHDRQRTADDRAECRPAAQLEARQRPVARGRVRIARPPARPALDRQQREHEQQQDDGDLRGRDRIAHAAPHPEDPGRERVDPEIGDGAVVVQRLHQRQRDARHDRRPRQRQRDAAKAAPRRAAEGAAHFQHAHRLLQERGARQQIDVGIEHQHQHQDGAGQRADRPAASAVRPGRRSSRAGWSAPARRNPATRYRRRRSRKRGTPSAAAAPSRTAAARGSGRGSSSTPPARRRSARRWSRRS